MELIREYYLYPVVAAIVAYFAVKLFFPRRCHDCGTVLLAGGKHSDEPYCPNPECPPES